MNCVSSLLFKVKWQCRLGTLSGRFGRALGKRRSLGKALDPERLVRAAMGACRTFKEPPMLGKTMELAIWPVRCLEMRRRSSSCTPT